MHPDDLALLIERRLTSLEVDLRQAKAIADANNEKLDGILQVLHTAKVGKHILLAFVAALAWFGWPVIQAWMQNWFGTPKP